MNSGPKLRLGAAARLGIVSLVLAGCGSGSAAKSVAVSTTASVSGSAEATASATSTTTAGALPPTTTTTTTTTTSTTTAGDVAPGELGVVITQNREDPARNQFQLEFVNRTRLRYDITNVHFLWDGLNSPSTPKESILVAGQTLDLPVPVGAANCSGDGTAATMPDVASAMVVTTLVDGKTITVAVHDKWNVVRRLYLEDCERQWIESQVTIEWTDLRRVDRDGRPVTAGSLRLTRRDGTGIISIGAVSGTIPFTLEPAKPPPPDQPWLTLDAAGESASVEVIFGESRCDPHALAETKQPFKFVAQVDLGDGQPHPYVIVPDEAWQVPMLQTANDACVALGKVEFVGD